MNHVDSFYWENHWSNNSTGGWDSFIDEIESDPKIINGNLDTNEWETGYSIDTAYDYFDFGLSVADYIRDIGRHYSRMQLIQKDHLDIN